MTRRRLMKLAAVSFAGMSLPMAWSGRLRADRLFEHLFGDAGLAARLGAEHKAKEPTAGERGQALVAELAGHVERDRHAALRDRVVGEFGRLDTVVVAGWVMARSEADLCVAVHLDRCGS